MGDSDEWCGCYKNPKLFPYFKWEDCEDLALSKKLAGKIYRFIKKLEI